MPCRLLMQESGWRMTSPPRRTVRGSGSIWRGGGRWPRRQRREGRPNGRPSNQGERLALYFSPLSISLPSALMNIFILAPHIFILPLDLPFSLSLPHSSNCRVSDVHTTAEPRPNAYIPEQLGIPKPYTGSFTPFKPTEPGATMRHIRKPEIRDIVI